MIRLYVSGWRLCPPTRRNMLSTKIFLPRTWGKKIYAKAGYPSWPCRGPEVFEPVTSQLPSLSCLVLHPLWLPPVAWILDVGFCIFAHGLGPYIRNKLPHRPGSADISYWTSLHVGLVMCLFSHAGGGGLTVGGVDEANIMECGW